MLIQSLPITVFTQEENQYAEDEYRQNQEYQENTADNSGAEDEKSWEETFPNGTFLFDYFQIDLRNGDPAKPLTVIRAGGGNGTATVLVSLLPPVDEDNAYVAASINDYILTVPDGEIVYPDDPYGEVVIYLVFEKNEFEKSIMGIPQDTFK